MELYSIGGRGRTCTGPRFNIICFHQEKEKVKAQRGWEGINHKKGGYLVNIANKVKECINHVA